MRKGFAAMLFLCLLCSALAGLGEDASQPGGLKGGSAVVPELSGFTRYEIPDNAAMAFLRDMGVGWNLGNTFDAYAEGVADEMTIEAVWNGTYTTEGMIDQLVAAGFRTLRIPVSWHNHVSGDDFRISEPWLNRRLSSSRMRSIHSCRSLSARSVGEPLRSAAS